MNKSTTAAVAGLALATLVTVAAPASAATKTAHTSRGWQCRTSSSRVHAEFGVDVGGTVCVHFAHSRWEGHGSVNLTAGKKDVPVSVSYGRVPLPERAVGLNGFANLTVPAGKTVTVPVDGNGEAAAEDVRASWQVFVTVANGDRAMPLEVALTSPIVRRTQRPLRPSTNTTDTDRACTVKSATDTPLGKAKIRLCVQQRAGQVVSYASLTYIAGESQDVTLETVVDGQVVQSNLFSTPTAPTRRVAVSSPSLKSQVFKSDHHAVTRLRIGSTTLESDPFTIRH